MCDCIEMTLLTLFFTLSSCFCNCWPSKNMCATHFSISRFFFPFVEMSFLNVLKDIWHVSWLLTFFEEWNHCGHKYSSSAQHFIYFVETAFSPLQNGFCWASYIYDNRRVKKHVSMGILDPKSVIFFTKQIYVLLSLE